MVSWNVMCSWNFFIIVGDIFKGSKRGMKREMKVIEVRERIVVFLVISFVCLWGILILMYWYKDKLSIDK